MRFSIQALLGIVLIILVILGIFGTVFSILKPAGSNISSEGRGIGKKLNCILLNKDDTEECETSTKYNIENKTHAI